MSFRFRKSIKIAPGVRLNISKSGVSTTLGGKGLSVNTGSKGTYLNAGIPGTGLTSRTRLDSPSTKSAGEKKKLPQNNMGNAEQQDPQSALEYTIQEDQSKTTTGEKFTLSSDRCEKQNPSFSIGYRGFLLGIACIGIAIALTMSILETDSSLTGSSLVIISVAYVLLLVARIRDSIFSAWWLALVLPACAIFFPVGLLLLPLFAAIIPSK